MTGSLAAGVRAAAWDGVSRPVRAVVRAGYCASVEGGYALDVEVVDPVSMEGTGETIDGVAAPLLWGGADGRGIYALPEAGQHVVIGWVSGSRAHPVLVGVDGGRHTPPEDVPAGELLLRDGPGARLRLPGDGSLALASAEARAEVTLGSRAAVRGGGESLQSVLLAVLDAVIDLQTVGAPALHAVSPGSVAALQAVRRRVEALLDA